MFLFCVIVLDLPFFNFTKVIRFTFFIQFSATNIGEKRPILRFITMLKSKLSLSKLNVETRTFPDFWEKIPYP